MRLAFLLALGSVAILTAFLVRSRLPKPTELPPVKISSGEITPICPWRNPPRDLAILFPSATEQTVETRILSSAMVSIQKQLGRTMRADENPLRIYRARNGTNVGSILVHRVKGEHGAIEIVTGIQKGAVRGVIIQSQREPDFVARAITNTTWLAAFVGKHSSSPLRLGEDLPGLSAEARPSAQAVADGVRAQLILLSFAQLPDASAVGAHDHIHR